MSRWPSIELSHISTVFNGKTPSKAEQRSSGHPVLKIRDVDENGRFRGPFASFVAHDLAHKHQSKKVKSGDILILNAAHNASHVGSKVYRSEPESVDALATGEWLVIRPDGRKLDPNYGYHWICASGTRQMIREFVKGIHLYPKDVARLGVPLPPLPEQRRIAAVLDKADALRAKRRAALAELDGLAQSIFLEMFGDPADRSNKWEKRVLAELCDSPDDIKCGPFGTQLAKSEFRNSGVPLWGIRNVNAHFRLPTHEFLEPETAKRLDQYSIVAGDIVMTRKGTVGNCAVYPTDMPNGIMHSDLLRLRVSRSKCDPLFLAHQLHHSRDVQRQIELISGGAIMPGINVTKLKSIEAIVPDLEMQQDFCNRVLAVGSLRACHRLATDELDILFSSLQHRAFRGEL